MSLVGAAFEWMVLSSRYSLRSVRARRERLERRAWRMEARARARVCVCLSVLSVRAWGEKSIDLRLHLDRLPLPSNGLTLWPLKVRRQLSRIACRHAICQPCMLARKFLSFSFFFILFYQWSFVRLSKHFYVFLEMCIHFWGCIKL